MMRANQLTYDPTDPLKRAQYKFLDGRDQREPRASALGLADYARMGPGRTVDGLWDYYQNRTVIEPLYKPLIKNKGRMRTYSMLYAWLERAQLYDRLEAERAQAVEREFFAEARRKIPRRDYEQGERLRELVDKSLASISDFVDQTEETKNGVTTIYKRLDIRAVIEALKVASELQRLALGMDRKQFIANLNINFNLLPTDVLERIAAGDDMMTVLAEAGAAALLQSGQIELESHTNVIDAQPAPNTDPLPDELATDQETA
jgi:hypothetical protein